MNRGREILEDMAASDWLKRAVVALESRDPVDAFNDTVSLLEVCRERLERLGIK